MGANESVTTQAGTTPTSPVLDGVCTVLVRAWAEHGYGDMQAARANLRVIQVKNAHGWRSGDLVVHDPDDAPQNLHSWCEAKH